MDHANPGVVRRTWTSGAGAALPTVLLVALLAGCGPAVLVPAGLHPRMDPVQVERVAMDQIRQMEEIAGRIVGPSRVTRIEAIRGGAAAPGFDGVTWRVDAVGTFATDRVPPGGPSSVVAAAGSFEIADADGSVISMAFR